MRMTDNVQKPQAIGLALLQLGSRPLFFRTLPGTDRKEGEIRGDFILH